MNRFFLFLKRNIMFVLILILILSITMGMIIYQNVSAQPIADGTSDVRQPDQSADDQHDASSDEEGDPVQISGFSGSVINDDTLLLTWEVENSGEKDIVSSELYYISQDDQETWLADVSNHTSYQLSQSAYQFESGENRFRIVCTLENGERVQAETTVQIAGVDDVRFEMSFVDEGLQLQLTYCSPSGSDDEIPLASYYDVSDTGFTIHYVGNETETRGDMTYGTVTYLMNDAAVAPGEQSFTLSFQFPKLGKSYEYDVRYVKNEDGSRQEVSTDEQ